MSKKKTPNGEFDKALNIVEDRVKKELGKLTEERGLGCAIQMWISDFSENPEPEWTIFLQTDKEDSEDTKFEYTSLDEVLEKLPALTEKQRIQNEINKLELKKEELQAKMEEM